MPRGDQDGAADGVAAVQGALGPAQYRDALYVEQFLRRQQVIRRADPVDAKGNRRLPRTPVLPDTANDQRADTDFLIVRKAQVRRQRGDAIDAFDTMALNILGRECRNRVGNVR